MEAAVGAELGPSQTAAMGGANKGFTTLAAATLRRSASRGAAFAIALSMMSSKRNRIEFSALFSSKLFANSAAIVLEPEFFSFQDLQMCIIRVVLCGLPSIGVIEAFRHLFSSSGLNFPAYS
ncbi:hypothetical protein RB195_008389 [Necator americanus]|uniref:Uncharacterized protein n=1 Tax=Necator americanus TaxID=51031 RepID=A0ABR1CNE9_NECAM